MKLLKQSLFLYLFVLGLGFAKIEYLLMQAYFVDLRERIVEAPQDGAILQQAADRFAVNLSTVKRYKAQHQKTGTIAPKPWPAQCGMVHC